MTGAAGAPYRTGRKSSMAESEKPPELCWPTPEGGRQNIRVILKESLSPCFSPQVTSEGEETVRSKNKLHKEVIYISPDICTSQITFSLCYAGNATFVN